MLLWFSPTRRLNLIALLSRLPLSASTLWTNSHSNGLSPLSRSPSLVVVGRTLQLLLVGLLVLGVLSGCSHSHLQTHSVATHSTTARTAVGIVKHAALKTRVSVHPQRVVILQDFPLEDALALGVKPVGAPKQLISKLQLDSLTARGIVDVDDFPTNIEKVLALKPDLILSLDVTHQDIYPLLSHIAPTVLVHHKSVQDWKDHFMQVAQVLGKTEQAQKVIDDYHSRLLSFKAAMGEKLSSARVSVISVGNKGIGIFRVVQREPDSFPTGILQEAGLAPIVSPTSKSSDHRFQIGGGYHFISEEGLSEVDGNVIFVVLRDSGVSQTAIKQLLATPLWSKLKAVQHGHVYQVGMYWLGSGPITANLALDDLFKYLRPPTLGHGQ